MVVTHGSAQSPEPTGATLPSTSETSPQAKLPREDAALHVWDCRGAWDLMVGLGLNGLFAHRCMLVKGLCHQVTELQEKVSRLHSIRNYETEINWIFSKTLQGQQPEPRAVPMEGQPSGKQLCRKGLGSPGGHQVEHESEMCLCGKEHQQPPGLH